MFTESELHTIYSAVFAFDGRDRGEDSMESVESILTKLDNHFQGR
jgi:hypothetical protein